MIYGVVSFYFIFASTIFLKNVSSNIIVMERQITQSTPWVLAFTPNYFIPAATCIWSALQHSNITDKFHIICLLTEDLSSDLKSRLQVLDKNEQLTFTFLNLKDILKGVYVDERYTVAASFRLLLPEILPEYDKVIYTDCDMIIRNNLADIFNQTDLGENYLGAVYEAPLDFQEGNMRKLGCIPGFYFNSGFLLMNLKKLREDNMSEKFIDGLKADYLEFPDQDVLNIQCQGNVLGMSPWYNSIRTFFLPKYKKFFLKKYTEEDWNKVWAHGTIHFTGAKPWNTYTVQFDEWWKYYFQLPRQVRSGYPQKKSMILLYRIYSTTIGRWMFNAVQTIYRKFK